MKTLTTLTAVAALFAGVSIANAAGMEKSNSLTGQQSANAAVCMHTKSGATECKFASIAACEKVAKPEGGTCAQNPHSTTGSATGSKMK